jgi:multidrug resistance efflux pump
MIADLSSDGGGAEARDADKQRAAVQCAQAQLSAALIDLKQAQHRLDMASAGVKEAVEQLRRAQR